MARVTRTVHNTDGSTTTVSKGGCETCSVMGCFVVAWMTVLALPAYYLPRWAAALIYAGAVAIVVWLVVYGIRSRRTA